MRRLFALFVLLAPCAWGQMSAAGGVDYNDSHVSSNIADCATAADCWQGFSQAGISVAARPGQVDVIDPSGVDHAFNTFTGAWAAHTEYGTVHRLQWAANGELYGLVHYNSAAKGYHVSRWTGSGWTDVGGCCFQSLSASRTDGLMLAHDVNGTIWMSTNYGTTFASHPFCFATSEASVGVDINGNPHFYVVCNDGKIWQYNVNWDQIPGAALAIAFGGYDHEGHPLVYIVGGGNAVYHYAGAGKWDKLNSYTTGNTIAIADENNIWTLNGSGAAMRFTQYGFTTVAKYTGEISACLPQYQTACNNSQHHLEFTLTVGNQTVSTTKDWSNVGLPWNVPLSITQHQAFVGNDTPHPTHSGKVLCSVLGPLVPLAVDEAVSDDVTEGESWEIARFIKWAYSVGPFDSGGTISAQVADYLAEACPLLSKATCPDNFDSSVPFDLWQNYTIGDPYDKALAEGWVMNRMSEYQQGKPSPWLFKAPYVKRNGQVRCLPPDGGLALWGMPAPACQ